jgi:hypothetical protein
VTPEAWAIVALTVVLYLVGHQLLSAMDNAARERGLLIDKLEETRFAHSGIQHDLRRIADGKE